MEPHADHELVVRAPREDSIDLARLLRTVRARKSWIFVPTLVAFLAALAFVTLVSPRYTAFTKVLLENEESYFTRPDKATPDLAAAYDDEAVQSEAEMVATADLAREAVTKLGLMERTEFNPAISHNPLAAVSSLIAGYRGASAVEDRVVENFLSRLTVFPIMKSRVLQIEFSSADPALAARGANEVANLFMSGQEEAKRNQAKAAAAWLSGKIAELRAKVAEADANVEELRSDSGLLAGANGMTAPSQQLAEITTQITSARAAQSAAAAKAQLLREMLRAGRLDAVPDFVNDESLRRYAEARVTLKSQIAEESRTLLPGHPRMKELSGQIAGLDEEIRAEVGKSVHAFEDEARLAGTQVSNLEGLIAKQSKTVAAGNADEVRLRALELDAKTAREQLESYIDKYREASAREADDATPANARVIATAQEPLTPSFPKKLPTILLATLAGFLLSAGIVVARALLLDGPGVDAEAPVRRVAPDERSPEASAPPHSGERNHVIEPAMPVDERPSEASAPPHDSGERNHVIEPAMPPDERSSEASAPLHGPGDEHVVEPVTTLETIVDRLAASAIPTGSLMILVTGEKTAGALALALTAARRLSKTGPTALVDLGLSQPWLGDVFDHAGEPDHARYGLADLLEGRASFDQALHRDLSARLDILPVGTGEVEADELEPVLAALAQSYAFVVIHASDWRAPTVAAAIGGVGAVIVCAPAARLDAAKERLRLGFADPTIVIAGVALAARTPLDRAA
jgi:succinoglycan biosynthesis transport protein ExoP